MIDLIVSLVVASLYIAILGIAEYAVQRAVRRQSRAYIGNTELD